MNTTPFWDSTNGVTYRVLNLSSLPAEQLCFRVREAFEAINIRTSFMLLTGTDPVTNLQQCQDEFKGRFEWKTLEHGPKQWRILITKIQS